MTRSAAPLPVSTLVVGVLAGGQGTRVGGADKGWIERDGVALIESVLAAIARNVRVLGDAMPGLSIGRVAVSANRSMAQYAALGVDVVQDRWPAFPGPMAGIASLALALRPAQDAHASAWLATLPVDAAALPDDYLAKMLHAADSVARNDAPIVAADAERDQPLFALYAPRHLDAIVAAFHAGERSIARWQREQHAHICRFPASGFGNLNSLPGTPSA